MTNQPTEATSPTTGLWMIVSGPGTPRQLFDGTEKLTEEEWNRRWLERFPKIKCVVDQTAPAAVEVRETQPSLRDALAQAIAEVKIHNSEYQHHTGEELIMAWTRALAATPEPRRVGAEVEAQIDASLGLKTLPPIRLANELHAATEAAAARAGIVVQEWVRQAIFAWLGESEAASSSHVMRGVRTMEFKPLPVRMQHNTHYPSHGGRPHALKLHAATVEGAPEAQSSGTAFAVDPPAAHPVPNGIGYDSNDLVAYADRRVADAGERSPDAQPEISREDWIAAAQRVYIACGDDEKLAHELAVYQADEQDWLGEDVGDPYETALDDIDGRHQGAGERSTPAEPDDTGPSEIEAVIACLGDDAATLRTENDEDEMAANMDSAARLLSRLATTPTQPAELSRVLGFVKPDNDRQVFFYEQDFYVLSNFSAFTLLWKGIRFDTSEAAYHWEKFPGDSGEAQLSRHFIMSAPSAHEAFKVAEWNKAHRRPDWDAVKVGIMREILMAKAEQHEYVRRKLLATGDRDLIEDSWRDDFWGWGPNRTGQNMLGKLWMEVRAELRAAQAKGGEQ